MNRSYGFRVFQYALMILGILTIPAMTCQSARAQDIFTATGASLSLRFDTQTILSPGNSWLVERWGNATISDSGNGTVLRLPRGASLGLNVRTHMHAEAGTLLLWVRPHWGYYAADKTNFPLSHTFVSMSWENNGYLVLSDGWWEPQGAPYTYFVANNQLRAHTRKDIHYEEDAWMLLTCTWQQGYPGFVRLYENAVKVAEARGFGEKSIRPQGLLYLGSDQGSSQKNNRWADCDIRNLAIFPRALSDAEVATLWNTTRPVNPSGSLGVTDASIHHPLPSRDVQGTSIETRAIFDEGTGWMTEAGARKTIDRISKAGFNVYIPCIWHGRGARYPTRVAPLDNKVPLTHKDPLARLIAIAHQNGIEVHPWFCVTLRQRAFLGDYYATLQTPYSAFDVHRPEFRTFIVNTVLDVVQRYDIDGINLDYIRTMGLCKCNYCVREYKRAYNRDLIADSTVNDLGRMEPHLQQWQDQAVEDIVRQIALAMKRLKPRLILSIDGHPRPQPMPPSWDGRQEIKWANAGLIDIIYNMEYSLTPDYEKHALIVHELKEPKKLIMLLGNFEMPSQKSPAPRDARKLESLIRTVQGKWPWGVGIYLYDQLNDEQIAALAQGPFREKARSLGKISLSGS